MSPLEIIGTVALGWLGLGLICAWLFGRAIRVGYSPADYIHAANTDWREAIPPGYRIPTFPVTASGVAWPMTTDAPTHEELTHEHYPD